MTIVKTTDSGEGGMNPVAMIIINSWKKYSLSQGSNHQLPVLRSATLPTELWGSIHVHDGLSPSVESPVSCFIWLMGRAIMYRRRYELAAANCIRKANRIGGENFVMVWSGHYRWTELVQVECAVTGVQYRDEIR